MEIWTDWENNVVCYLSGLVKTLRNYWKIVLLHPFDQLTVNRQYFRTSYTMTKAAEFIYNVTRACFVCKANKKRTWSIAGILLNILSYSWHFFQFSIRSFYSFVWTNYPWYQINMIYIPVIILCNNVLLCWRPLYYYFIHVKWMMQHLSYFLMATYFGLSQPDTHDLVTL